jgi:ubiquinone/menaquinone biosynthesis C-methylase UbiE
MHDIHRTFQDIDQLSEANVLFQFLDAVDAVESIQTYRQCMLELVPARPGEHILDVGCGIGHSAVRLAQLVGPTGRVVGIDKSENVVREARCRMAERSLPLEYHVGNAQRLIFPEHSFDVCRTERVLMYIEQPQQVLDEMVRVLRPGGALILFEFDYDGMVVDSPEQTLTRRIGRLIADSVPSGWIGRQAPRLLRERGLCEVTVVPQMVLTPYPLYRRVVGGTLDAAVHAGQLAAAEVASWWCALERAAAAGQFFAGFQGFIVSGRVP